MERAVWKTLRCLCPFSLLMLYCCAVSLCLTSLLSIFLLLHLVSHRTLSDSIGKSAIDEETGAKPLRPGKTLPSTPPSTSSYQMQVFKTYIRREALVEARFPLFPFFFCLLSLSRSLTLKVGWLGFGSWIFSSSSSSSSGVSLLSGASSL
jgi:hypothetical protein